MSDNPDTRCGLVALVGRPNVGKSTLLNFILEQKLSITSRKPQTTRQQVLGVKTVDKDQMIFVDTPGLHRNEPRAINKAMNKSATSAMADVDLVLFLIDRGKWTEEDSWVLEKLRSVRCRSHWLLTKWICLTILMRYFPRWMSCMHVMISLAFFLSQRCARKI